MSKAQFIMSLSTTQRAILNQLGFVPGAGFKTSKEQEVYRQNLVKQLESCED